MASLEIIRLSRTVQYEGQAAMLLEALATEDDGTAYPLDVVECRWIAATDPGAMWRALLNDVEVITPNVIAACVHTGFADSIAILVDALNPWFPPTHAPRGPVERWRPRVIAFRNNAMKDQASPPLANFARHGDRLAFAIGIYVVDPLFFPGSDTRTLAVGGTVNDLVVGGARLLSCGMVLEEGLPAETLRRVADSLRRLADRSGLAILIARSQLRCGPTFASDCRSLDGLIAAMLAVCPPRMREPTDMVVMQTTFGGERIIGMLVGEQLARSS